MFGNNYYQQPMNAMQGYSNPYQARLDSLQAMQSQQMMPQRQELIRVNGDEGAKAYPIAPNSVVPLFDGNEDVIYVKGSDAGGFSTIRKFQLVEITGNTAPAPVPSENYATKEYVSGLENRLAEMEKVISELNS